MTKDMGVDIIPIDDECKRFYHHLSHNERVIFSAKFGDGKTFFLNKFFEQKGDEFFCIKVYPINYQVEENKDIFELIKKDVLIQLIAADEISKEQILDDTICQQYYLWNNGGNILLDILSSIPVVDTPSKIIKKVIKRIGEYILTKNEVQKTDREKVEEYIKFFQSKPGCCKHDVYSSIITDCIDKIKGKGKKVVLVIEDLDRIDPAHLFRILNVLTAHIDICNNEVQGHDFRNKFGFDYIVLVCDYQNVENIFHHFYGDNTDFKGYIHKYSTSKPFCYSIREVIQDYLFNQLKDDDLILHGKFVKEVIMKIVSDPKEYSLRDICSKFKMNFDDIMTVENTSGYSLHTPFMKFLVLCHRFDINPDVLLEKIFVKMRDSKMRILDFYEFVGIHWTEVYDHKGAGGNVSLAVPSTEKNCNVEVQIPYHGSFVSPEYLGDIKRIADICKSKYLDV